MTGPPIPVVTGQAVALPIQCNLRGSGSVPAVFSATDTLSAGIYQSRQTVAIFQPVVSWYTADSTQAGYPQGQVEASWTSTQAALLVPSTSYTLLIWRTVSANLELIARVPLVVEPLAV